MTKAELAGEVAKLVGLTKVRTSEVIEAFFGVIQSSLSRGERVKVVGFGAFEVRQRAARKGHNFQKPGEPVHVPEKTVAVFCAGKTLKNAVNPPVKRGKKK